MLLKLIRSAYSAKPYKNRTKSHVTFIRLVSWDHVSYFDNFSLPKFLFYYLNRRKVYLYNLSYLFNDAYTMLSYLIEELSKAIGARLLVRFDYNGITYVVEPHLVGHNNNLQDCLCAWLVEHPNTKKNNWHFFQLGDIENLKVLEERFYKQRPGYDPYDNSMSSIYYRI